MSDPILIAYATRYGSTQEVAEAIARELRERGLEVEIQPLRQIQTTEGYGLVVGTPFYMGHWLGEVNRFLSQVAGGPHPVGSGTGQGSLVQAGCYRDVWGQV